jgi:hypothetical protein
MVKWKYPSLFICFSIMIINPILLSPTLRSITTKYSSVFWLNDSESRSFVETQIVPWIASELVISSSVDHFQLTKFIIKPLHQQSLIYSHIYQAIRWSKFKNKVLFLLDNLRLLLNKYLRLWASEDLRLSMNIILSLLLIDKIVLGLVHLFPNEVKLWLIPFVFFLIMQLLVNFAYLL